MLFSSALFLFWFLPVVLLVYFTVRPSLRNTWLLLVSLLFYAWGEKLLVAIMLVSIAANYGFGLWIERVRGRGGSGRSVVAWAVVFNIGLLLLFKYADWLWRGFGYACVLAGLREEYFEPLGSFIPAESAWRTILLDQNGWIRLPIGISFFTFQAFSYVVDVYRRDTPVQRKLGDFALYVALFPQLIAGPIVRYKDVAQQLVERVVTREGFASGIRRFTIGLAKKMLIANPAAECCDRIFDGIPLEELPPGVAWLGITCYTLQIYFDFSGYSDMAIGLGRMFGFEFLENFRHPYVSRSVTEFWRRWHISLSTWFRDYLYVPLGGNRAGAARTYFNLLTVFVLCGMWHGASQTFLVWGLFHGLFLVLERAFLGKWLERSPALLGHVYLLLVVVVGWVFFRAHDLNQAFGYLAALFGLSAGDAARWPLATAANPLVWTVVGCGIVGSMPWLARVVRWRDALEARRQVAAVWVLEGAGLAALAVLFVLSAAELAARGYNPFIYFRF